MKNKILIIFTIVIICFLCINISSVYASEISTADEYNTLPEAVSNAVHSLNEYGNSNYSIYVFQPGYSSSYRAVIIDNTIHTDFVVWYNSKHIQIDFFDFMYYDITTDGAVGERQVVTPGSYNNYGEDYQSNTGFLFSNITVRNDNTGVTTFFQVPLQENLTLEGTIVEMAQTQIIPTVLMMIATAIGLLISLIGLKKGFKMLVNGLKT